MEAEPEIEETEPMTWSEAYELFDNFLDEVYDTVRVAWFEVDVYRAVKELDPIAYRCEFLNWADSEGIDTDALTGVDRDGN